MFKAVLFSVRGHGAILGDNNATRRVDGGGVIPDGVGTEFTDPTTAGRAAAKEAKGASSYHMIHVLNSDQELVMVGHRNGPSGTGKTFVFRNA